MRVIDRGVVFPGQKDTDCQSCAFPGMAVLSGGRWICGFRAAHTKAGSVGQHVLLTWSDDEGKSWCAPFNPFVPPLVDGKPGKFRCVHFTPLNGHELLATLYWVDYSEPSLPFFNEETEGLMDSRIFFSKSYDNGLTWTRPRLMDTSPFNCPTPITGPVLHLSDGTLICQFELNKHYYDTSVWRHSSVLMFSKDEGETWPEYVITSNDPENRIFYWDQRPGVLSDGRILDVFWPYDSKTAVYLNILARESFDNGRTWSDYWDTKVPGQPSAPVSLRDGRIAMVYVDRTSVPVIKMRVSRDNGRTWQSDTEGVIYKSELLSQTLDKKSMQDAWAEMGKFSIGLPVSALLQNGDLLVIHYAGPRPDQTGIQWVRVQV